MSVEIVLLILILSSGFYLAWNIGANDVANAMGTSVGSQALTLKQAIFIAAILEFSGAFFFGSHVSETVQNGIISSEIFVHEPFKLMLGMLSALISAGIWLQVASYFGWPVSTTHAIVGAIVGFGLVMGGFEAIYWEHVAFIFASWVVSPILGGIFGYIVFNLIRTQIFYAPHPVEAAKKWLPPLVFGVFSLLFLLLLFNGLENLKLDLGFFEASFISIILALIAALITKVFVETKIISPHLLYQSSPSPEIALQLETLQTQLRLAKQMGAGRFENQMRDIISDLENSIKALEHADEFDHTKADFEIIEKMFGYLQIASACMMAFAHGANDVANAIGPLSAAMFILYTGTVAIEPTIPTWALALGGIGIVVGLATWGWRVIETIGKKITELTPTRGFSAEFGAAFTILVASRLGMPISTTHTLVGAVIGVGLARGIGALNLGMTRDIIASWVITIPAGAILALGVYSGLVAIFEF